MWVFESCGYVFSKLKFCGYLYLWVFKNCGYSNLWVHKICDDTKFQVNGREYQNICVLCISCVGCKGFHTFEPRREKTGFLHLRKQRRRSASR